MELPNIEPRCAPHEGWTWVAPSALVVVALGAVVAVPGCGGQIPLCEGTSCNVVQLSAAGDSTCALFEGGVLACWGDNSYGALGRPTPFASVNRRAVFVPGPLFDLISLGAAHGCGISTGAVYCWGNNRFGQLGNGSPGDGHLEPTLVPGIAGAMLIAAADELESSGGPDGGSSRVTEGGTCAYVPLEGVYCWGGQSGHATPTLITGTSWLDVSQLIVGSAGGGGTGFGCALATGSLWCWMLGDTSATVVFSDVSSITSNGSSWCAMSRAGTRCGSGRPTPDVWLGPSSGTTFGGSALSSCSVVGGLVRCTGGDLSTSLQSVDLTGRRTVEGSVALGRAHACVIDGGDPTKVLCSGANIRGQTAQPGDRTPEWAAVAFE